MPGKSIPTSLVLYSRRCTIEYIGKVSCNGKRSGWMLTLLALNSSVKSETINCGTSRLQMIWNPKG